MEPENLYLTSFQRKLLLKKLSEENLSELNRQRIEIMILADQGKSQVYICHKIGCCTATARHWIHMARSGMAHLWEESPRGRPRVVTDAYLERLGELLTHSPKDYKYPFSRWTADWLRKHLTQEFKIDVSLRHFKRLLKQVKVDQASTLNTKDNPCQEITALPDSHLFQKEQTQYPMLRSSLQISDLTIEL
jgi:transposase